jgi:hypothetical protein
VCCFRIIIIIIIIVSFMQDIHTRIPETNHVPRGYTVASILSLSFMVPLFLVPALAVLFFYISTLWIIIIIIIIRLYFCLLFTRFKLLLLLLLLLCWKHLPLLKLSYSFCCLLCSCALSVYLIVYVFVCCFLIGPALLSLHVNNLSYILLNLTVVRMCSGTNYLS